MRIRAVMMGVVGLALAAATTARAQGQGEQAPPPQRDAQRAPQASAPSGTSDAFNQACLDLLHGRMPDGEQAIKALRDACANLMSGRADEKIEAARKRQQ